MRSTDISDADWQALLVVYENRCAYCGEVPMRNGKVVMCVEHAIPFCRGGWDATDNVFPACASCNNSKNSLTPLEFFAVRIGLLERTSPKNHDVYVRVVDDSPVPPTPFEWKRMRGRVVNSIRCAYATRFDVLGDEELLALAQRIGDGGWAVEEFAEAIAERAVTPQRSGGR